MKTFTSFAKECISQLYADGRIPCAHLYHNALRSFSEFRSTPRVYFQDINVENLKSYETYLRDRHKLPNTISTYMRNLRAIYNKGVDCGYAIYVHNLFHHVYTGVDSSHKKCIDAKQLQSLLYTPVADCRLHTTQLTARMLFELLGMSFADLSHLRPENLQNSHLRYSRMKTGTNISVDIMKSTDKTLRYLSAGSAENCYLLHFLSGRYQIHSKAGYREYHSALRLLNNRLQRLAAHLGIKPRVSSYTFRHTWASMALRRHIPIEQISSALGHKSIKTTQIYLNGFSAHELASANRKVCMFAQRATV